MEKKVILNKTGFWSSVEKQMSNLMSATEKYLGKSIGDTASTAVDNSLDGLLKDFKKNVTVLAADGSTLDFPDEVYKTVMQHVISVEAPSFSDGEDSIIKMVGAYISDLLNPNTETVTVSGTTYKISGFGSSTLSLATVTAKGKQYTVSWSDSSKINQTVKSFMASVTKLTEENLSTKVLVAIAKDIGGFVKDSGMISYLVKAITKKSSDDSGSAREFFQLLKPYLDLDSKTTKLTGKLGSLLSKVYNNITSKSDAELTKQAGELTAELFPSASNASTKYDAAVSAYNTFSTYINGSNVTVDSLTNSKQYKNFITAYNALESSIGQSTTSFSGLIETYTVNQFTNVSNQDISDNYASINGTAQGDVIISRGTRVTLNGNDGNDTLTAYGSVTEVYGGNGDDKFLSYGSNVTIYGNSGVDIIGVESGATKNRIYGGLNNDSIAVKGSNNTIHGEAGNDEIIISASSNVAYGDEGDDVIFIDDNATSNTVLGGAGNDWIRVNNTAKNNTVLGGEGNDTISLESSAVVTIDFVAGDGNDTVIGFNEDDVLNVSKDYTTATIGNDVMVYVGNNSVMLKDTAGKTLNIKKPVDFSDLIAGIIEPNHNDGGSNTNTDTNVITDTSVKVISGNDITNNSDGVVLNAQDSATIRNTGSHVSIYGSEKDDTLSNGYYERQYASSMWELSYGGDYVIVHGGNGYNDLENLNGNNVTIMGGNDRNHIDNIGGYRVSISGGAGNDYIYSYGNNVTITSGDGDDTIKINDSTDVIILSGNGNDSLDIYNGNNITVIGGEGNDYIDNTSGDGVSIYGNAGKDTILNRFGGDNATINSGEGDDYISNGDAIGTIYGGASAAIYGDAGNDIICNRGNNVTIDGGVGNDSIDSDGDNVTINGGDGDDYIYNTSGKNVTISGGKGNDYIECSAYNYINVRTCVQYADGDGDDTIGYFTNIGTGLENANTLQITSGNVDTIYSNGSDFTVKVGAGSITLIDARYVNIGDSYGNVTRYYYSYDGLIHSTVDGTNATNLEKSGDAYDYTGGNKTISNFASGEVIDFAATYTGWYSSGNEIALTAVEGSLFITEATNKIVEIAVGGKVIAHACIAENYAGPLDGRAFGEYEVIVGANNLSNQIYAGNGGSSLWGGGGNANDELYGGAGYDEFIYNSGNGQDVIFNASSNDIVNLDGVAIDQFVGLEVNASAVSATFADGGSLRVEGNSRVGYKLGNVIYAVNQSTNEWYTK